MDASQEHLVVIVCAANKRATKFDNEIIENGARAAMSWLVGDRTVIAAREFEDSLDDCYASYSGSRQSHPIFTLIEDLFRVGFYGVIGLAGPQTKGEAH